MTFVVLVILAALWAVVLLPPLLRSRTERSGDSIGDFNYRLDVLGRTNGQLRPEAARLNPSSQSAKRRRDVMRVLGAGVIATALLAMATDATIVWALQVLADVALVGFFALWAWSRSVQAERELKVRTMPVRRKAEQPMRQPMRRVASSS